MSEQQTEPPAQLTVTAEPASSDQRLLLHMPVDVRSVSLAILALLASLAAMQWARTVLIPILLGVMMSYALTPAVSRLHRWGVPRAVGAAVLLISIASALTLGTWSLKGQASALLDTLPQVTAKVRELTRNESGSESPMEKVQRAAVELEAVTATATPASAASAASSVPPGSAGTARARAVPAQKLASTPAPAEHSRIDIRSYVLTGTMGVISFLGQVAIVFLIALFLLASGNSFRRKMVKLAGPKLSQKKVTVETMDEISDQIQRYLLVQLAISVLVGVITGLAFYAIGLEQAAVWGVVACLTNLIPYLGAILVGLGAAVVALVQFGTIDMALLVCGSSFAIHTVVGNLLTPWWMGRASRLSPVAVFVAVLLFGWLWGTWGLFLGVPILMVVKSICDRVEELHGIGELLGA